MKRFAVSLILLGLTVFLMGHAPAVAEDDADLRVMVWYMPGHVDVVVDEALIEFQEIHGITIDLERASDRDIYWWYLLGGMEGDDSPDLLWVDPLMAELLWELDELAELDELVESERELLGEIPAELLETYVLDGSLYGIPLGVEDDFSEAAYAVSRQAMERGRGGLALELIALLKSRVPSEEVFDEEMKNLREEMTEEGEENEVTEEMARIALPVYMYFLNRYFADVPEKTDLDLEIASILDENPAGREFLLTVLESYQEMGEDEKYESFDFEMVEMTAHGFAIDSLDLGYARERMSFLESMLEKDEAPAAPGGLSAKNRSGEPDAPAKYYYSIELTWQDNSSDEDGFVIYRKDSTASSGSGYKMIATVGSGTTTFRDSLSAPSSKTDMFCYYVRSFSYATMTLKRQPPGREESDPTQIACAYYWPGYPPPPPPKDTDGDGVPDPIDKCKYTKCLSSSPACWEGCPDGDKDFMPDFEDQCPNEWADPPDSSIGSAPQPKKGCPIKYNLRWMDMEVHNNSLSYAHSAYSKEAEGDKFPGEEPYLYFSLLNGVDGYGAPRNWTKRWCCGDNVDVKSGKSYEPDADSSGEENPWGLTKLRNHGLTIMPSVYAPPTVTSSEIDKKLGLAVTVTLMERDWSKQVKLDDVQAAMDSAMGTAGSVIGAISTCVGSGGIGCLVSVGKAIKALADMVFNLSQSPTYVTVKDADDLQGSDFWAISRAQAQYATDKNGAYGFWFDTPTTSKITCLGWTPCSVNSPFKAYVNMRARLRFCLYREGISESQIKSVCTPYEMVLPWPLSPKYKPGYP